MGNGIAEIFKMSKFEKLLNKVISIRKKYGNNMDEVTVNYRITIKFCPHLKTLFVMINGNKYIKYCYGKIRANIKNLTTVVTLGTLDPYISLETKDKSVTTKEYIKEVYDDINENLSFIEEQFKNKSNQKWG